MSIIDIIHTLATIFVACGLAFFLWLFFQFWRKEMKKKESYQAPVNVRNHTEQRKVEINISSITVNNYSSEQQRLIATSEGEPLEKLALLGRKYMEAEMRGESGSKLLNRPVKEIIYEK